MQTKITEGFYDFISPLYIKLLGGYQCCKSDSSCNGEKLTQCSTCCLYDDFVKCPQGSGCNNFKNEIKGK